MKKINCVLLVDDSEPTNVFNKYVISKVNFCNYVKIAKDGEEALSYIKKAGSNDLSEFPVDREVNFPNPDLIFLDINMPRMNGFEFLDEYKKFDANLKSAVQIIVLTTSLNPDDQKRALGYKEVAGFQRKPLTTKMIIETMENYF